MNSANEMTQIVNQSNEPVSTVASRRPLLRRWGFWLTFALLATLAVPLVDMAYRHYRVAAELEKAVGELDRDDPGWRLQELEAARAVVPESDNSAVVVTEAARWVPPFWPSLECFERYHDLPPQERLRADAFFCLQNEFSEIQIAQTEARKLADLPYGRHPICYNVNVFATPLPQIDHSQRLMTVLSYDVLACAEDGDRKTALRSCRGILNAGRSLGDEPFFFSQLVRIRSVTMACKAVERTLGQGQADAADLRDVQRLLELEEQHPRLAIMVRGERACLHDALSAFESGVLSFHDITDTNAISWTNALPSVVTPDAVREQHPAMLELFAESLEATRKPTHERDALIRTVEAKAKAKRDTNPAFFAPKSFRQMADASRRCDALLRCTIAALAAEQYRLSHKGEWPESLNQLKPELLAAVPLDPMDGAPLRYERRKDRVVLYSLCPSKAPNGTDVSYNPKELSPPGVGVAFHLFQMEQRRQAPSPVPAAPALAPAKILPQAIKVAP
jgi:hypothetical protein